MPVLFDSGELVYFACHEAVAAVIQVRHRFFCYRNAVLYTGDHDRSPKSEAFYTSLVHY